MQSKQKQSKRARVVHRAIKIMPTVVEQPPVQSLEPGEVAQAAVTAAAMHQLNRYAADIEQFLRASKMRTLLNRLQAEVAPPTVEEQTHMRLRRE